MARLTAQLCIFILLALNIAVAQNNVGIGTNQPNSSAILDIQSSQGGLLLPRMTNAERDAILTPENSLLIFNSDEDCFQTYIAGNWHNLFCAEACTSAPSMPASISGSTQVCSGGTGHSYSITPVADAESYAWSIPIGSSLVSGQGTEGVTINFGNNSGEIWVVAVNDCGASDAQRLVVQVSDTPQNVSATFSPSAVCEGQQVNLTASGINVDQWVWTGPNNFSSNTQFSVINAAGTQHEGVYTLTASNNCAQQATAQTDTLIVSRLLQSSPDPINGPTAVNSGASLVQFSIPELANADSYTWEVPCDATIVSGQGTNSIVVNFPTIGDPQYTFTNSVANLLSCVDGFSAVLIGAGGNGGSNGGGGGGGGAYASGSFANLNGLDMWVVVGAAGSQTATSVGTLIEAGAGRNGFSVPNPQVGGGGTGGTATGGTINHHGGNGGGGFWTYVGGGGGGAAGSNGDGFDGTGTTGSYPADCCAGCPWLGGTGGSGNGALAGDGGDGGGFMERCTSTYKICGSAGGNYGGGGGAGNGDGCAAFPGGSGYARINSIVYGGTITVRGVNACGSSPIRNHKVIIQ